MNTLLLAEKHSANCFLNSLFREWSDFSYDQNSTSFIIQLKNNEQLIIPLHYYSLVGRHDCEGHFFIKKEGVHTLDEISFLELVEIISNHLAEKYQVTSEQLEKFTSRIENSLSSIHSALELRADDLEKLYKNDNISFQQAEQALIIGHTFHPHPKSRDEFSEEDYKKYAPETKGEFSLSWFLVKPEILHEQISKNFENKNWVTDLFINEEGKILEGYIPFPVHPWQRNVLLKNPLINDYITDGLIIDCGKTSAAELWTPTSSLRSIYKKSSPYMLKFSMSVRLTNSVRHLLPLEVVRGLQVIDVFSTENGKEFLKNYPTFHVVFEPAFMALVDKNKKIINETIVAMRLNPFQETTSSRKLVLATLTQDHPVSGLSMIGSFIKKEQAQTGYKLSYVAKEWFQKYLDHAVKPLLMAQANYGIFLGAHQQNLILEIQNNMPVASYFRDCQGTGYSQTGFDLFSKDVELMTRDNGNVLDEKMGNYLFSYYLIINSTFNVITAIARDSQVKEEILMALLRKNLLEWKASGVKDSSCFNYLLNEKELMQKGNFLCSFVNMNENTTENPLSIYNPIPNPIYEKELC